MKCARACKALSNEGCVKRLLKLMGANRGTLLHRSWRELSGALTALPTSLCLYCSIVVSAKCSRFSPMAFTSWRRRRGYAHNHVEEHDVHDEDTQDLNSLWSPRL